MVVTREFLKGQGVNVQSSERKQHSANEKGVWIRKDNLQRNHQPGKLTTKGAVLAILWKVPGKFPFSSPVFTSSVLLEKFSFRVPIFQFWFLPKNEHFWTSE